MYQGYQQPREKLSARKNFQILQVNVLILLLHMVNIANNNGQSEKRLDLILSLNIHKLPIIAPYIHDGW